jgi:hypothetical protein
MQIFVKTISGRTLVFEVDGNETVNNLKEMITDREGIPMNCQRLMHNGKQLDSNSDDSLLENGIERESTVHIVLHLLGGGGGGGVVDTSLFIPSVYANITDKDIAKTFHRMKIGKVSYVDLVAHRGSDKKGKHNRAFVYFSELYNTAESQTLMNEIHSQDSTRMHYAKSPHVFWVLVKNKGRSNNGEFQRHHSPSFESISEDEDNFDFNTNEYHVDLPHAKPMTMSELDVSTIYDEDHSVADSFDDMVNEFENEMDPIEDFSVVSSDYANQLEVELYNLRYHYNILAASYMQQQQQHQYGGNGDVAATTQQVELEAN